MKNSNIKYETIIKSSEQNKHDRKVSEKIEISKFEESPKNNKQRKSIKKL